MKCWDDLGVEKIILHDNGSNPRHGARGSAPHVNRRFTAVIAQALECSIETLILGAGWPTVLIQSVLKCIKVY